MRNLPILKRLTDKYRSFPVTMKAAFWFTVCNFMLKGISFICMPIYADVMSTEEYGDMSLITSYELILTIFATFELYLGAFQRGLLKFKDDVKRYEQTIVMFSNVLTLLCLGLVLIFHKPFTNFTGISVGLYSLFTTYFITQTPYNCWLNKKRFEYDYKAAVLVTLSMAVLSNFAPLITMKIFGATALVKVATTLIVQTLFALPFWISNLRLSNLFSDWSKVKEYLKFAFLFQGPLVFHSLSYYVLNQSDRVMIDKFTDKTCVAMYSVAYSFANVIIIFQNSLNQVLKPWRFHKLDEKSYKDVRNISNVLVIVVGTVIYMFMLVLPEVFKLVFNPKYYSALQVVPPVTIGVYFLFLYTLFVDVESYYGKTTYIAYVSTFCALLNIVLNYFGIKQFGYVACAYTTLICYALMSFLHYLCMLLTCKRAGIKEQVVDSKSIWGFSIIMLIMFALGNIFYSSVIFRYSTLCIVLLLVFLFRKRIITMWKQIRSR